MRYNLNPTVTEVAYMSNSNHHYLATPDLRNNIGEDQNNLTIVILSLNRTQLTQTLLNSIKTHVPNFRGKVLIVDNGSTKRSIEDLTDFLHTYPLTTQLVALDKNYGISGGRNRSIPYVTTEWLMFLDNDIYFTNNPFPAAQKTIAHLGCHFLNLPLLDSTGNRISALGGHLYISFMNDIPHITCDSAYRCDVLKESEIDPFLSTHIHGGSSILKKSTFLQLGGFDENIFIGYEDVDLSIRIYNAGLKIANCGVLCLVHNHVISHSADSLSYEKLRFSLDQLKSCATYFNTKHHLVIWSAALESAISQRAQSIQHVTPSPTQKKLTLVVDAPNWAFFNIAKQLKRYLSDTFEINIIIAGELTHVSQVLLLAQNSDIIHFFWRAHLLEILSINSQKFLATQGFFRKEYLALLNKVHISTAIYDHLYLNQRDLQKYQPVLEAATQYYVSSNTLKSIYEALPRYPNPHCVLQDGVDLDLFKPTNLQRFDTTSSRQLIIGWAGNSGWNNPHAGCKGVHTILKPAIEQLILEGYDLTLLLADRQEQLIEHEAMPAFYNQLDIYICTSSTEGTPNPVLEAMACGIPIISTNVGIVHDVLGPMQQHYILNERSIEALKSKLKELYHNKALLKDLSQENLTYIKNYSWEIQAELFKHYFIQILE